MLHNGVVPPPPPPGVDDPIAPFWGLYSTCRAMNSSAPSEVSSLNGDANEMVENDHCEIDTSEIVVSVRLV